MSVLDSLNSEVYKHSNNIFSITPTSKERYSEFHKSIHQLCYKIMGSIGSDKKVFLIGKNSSFYIKWFFALGGTKNVSIHVPTTFSDKMLEECILKYKPDVIVTEDPWKMGLQKIIDEKSLNVEIWDLEQSYLDNYNEKFYLPPTLSIRQEDLATCFFNKGSPDAAPKLSCFNHGAIETCFKLSRIVYKISPADVVFSSFPFSHPFGFFGAVFGSIQSGAALLYPPLEREQNEQLKFIYGANMSTIFSTPEELQNYIRAVREKKLQRRNLKRSFVTCSGIGEYIKTFYEESDDIKIQEVFGITEAAWTVSINKEGEVYRFGSQGKLYPRTKIKLINSDGEEQPHFGQLNIKSDCFMMGYFEDLYPGKENNAMVLKIQNDNTNEKIFNSGNHANKKKRLYTPGEWFLSNDFVELDEEGYFYFIAKSDEEAKIQQHLKKKEKEKKKNIKRRGGKVVVDAEIIFAGKEIDPVMEKMIEVMGNEKNMNLIPPVFIAYDKLIESRGISLIAKIEQNPVGFIRATPLPHSQSFSKHICSVETFILSKMRNKSVGSQLFLKMMPCIKKLDYQQIVTYIPSGNLYAITYLQKFGFQKAGIIKNYAKVSEDRFLDFIILEKSIV